MLMCTVPDCTIQYVQHTLLFFRRPDRDTATGHLPTGESTIQTSDPNPRHAPSVYYSTMYFPRGRRCPFHIDLRIPQIRHLRGSQLHQASNVRYRTMVSTANLRFPC